MVQVLCTDQDDLILRPKHIVRGLRFAADVWRIEHIGGKRVRRWQHCRGEGGEGVEDLQECVFLRIILGQVLAQRAQESRAGGASKWIVSRANAIPPAPPLPHGQSTSSLSERLCVSCT
ncbi:hypothetical protein M758_9G034700 [Ceratodon purpureus]|nr:hypothetical protein M758_9G034700 [Ceratodon purpureus]